MMMGSTIATPDRMIIRLSGADAVRSVVGFSGTRYSGKSCRPRCQSPAWTGLKWRKKVSDRLGALRQPAVPTPQVCIHEFRILIQNADMVVPRATKNVAVVCTQGAIRLASNSMMPKTTPIANDSAKTLTQNISAAIQAGSRVALSRSLKNGSTQLNVMVGKRMWNELLAANCMRERKNASMMHLLLWA